MNQLDATQVSDVSQPSPSAEANTPGRTFRSLFGGAAGRSLGLVIALVAL